MIWRKLTLTISLIVLAYPFTGWAADAAKTPLEPVLEPLLAGEFYLQQGNYELAAEHYLAAARQSSDPAVAQRATAAAMASNNIERIDAAIARWQQLAPKAPGLLDARTSLALRTGDAAAVVVALRDRLTAGEDGWRGAVQILSGPVPADRVTQIIDHLLDDDALPNELTAWLAFAGLAERLGRDALANRVVDGLIERFPDAPRAWLLKAGRLREQGDTAAARKAVDQALASVGEDVGLRMALAGELSRLGDPAAAAAVLASGKQELRTLRARAGFLNAAEDKQGLAKLYEQSKRVAQGESDAEWLLLLGQLAEALERHDEALDWYRAVAAGAPRDQAQVRIAVVLNARGDFAAAMVQLDALQTDAQIDGEVRRDSFLLEAGLRGEHEGMAQEVMALDRGLAVFEDDPELLYARALAHERGNQIGKSEADFRRILEMDPGNVAALNALGYTLVDRTERLEEGLRLIERAYDQAPDNAAIMDSLGWALYKLGRVAEALPHLQRAAELSPDAEVLAHLAEALWRNDEREAARAALERARAIAPQHRAVLRADQWINP